MSDLTEAQLAEFVTSLETLQENLQQQLLSSAAQAQPVTLDQQAVGRVLVGLLRLKAQPYARWCLQCQTRSEQ